MLRHGLLRRVRSVAVTGHTFGTVKDPFLAVGCFSHILAGKRVYNNLTVIQHRTGRQIRICRPAMAERTIVIRARHYKTDTILFLLGVLGRYGYTQSYHFVVVPACTTADILLLPLPQRCPFARIVLRDCEDYL